MTIFSRKRGRLVCGGVSPCYLSIQVSIQSAHKKWVSVWSRALERTVVDKRRVHEEVTGRWRTTPP